MIPLTWYRYLVRVDYDCVYCDHLAICILSELLAKQQNPILTSYEALRERVNHLTSEIKHSVELLKSFGLIEIDYPTDPHQLLSGAIAIKLNISRIKELSDGFPNSISQPTPRDGIVYVVRSAETNQFKIGRTVDLPRRLKQLQSMNSQCLSVFKTIQCHDAIATESALHQKFKCYRRKGSEWFSLPDEAISFIKSL